MENFKPAVGYYMADTHHGVFFADQTPLDGDYWVELTPELFIASLKDLADDEFIYAYFDAAALPILSRIDHEYGLRLLSGQLLSTRPRH